MPDKKEQTRWSMDKSHSEIEFKIRHLMIAHVKGRFRTFIASIYTYGNDFTTAEIDIAIEVKSISTGDETRDAHLIGTDFFDADKYAQINFTSSTMGNADAEGNHELWGELTMRGITKNIKLNVHEGGMAKDPWGHTKVGFSVTGSILRKDWEFNWNNALDGGGFVLGESIEISCEIELIHSGKRVENLTIEPTIKMKNVAL